MGLDRLRKEWVWNEGNPYGELWLWDGFSVDFDDYPIPGDDNFIISAMNREYWITEKTTVLDIGCGSGQYSAYMGRKAGDVMGIDISSKMIANAEKRCSSMGLDNVSFAVADWNDPSTLEKIGGKRDLVFARMTPAIGSAKALENMCSVCGGMGFVMKAARRNDKVMNRILSALGRENKGVRWADNEVPWIFEMLWRLGYKPKVFYGTDFWNNERPLDVAVEYYTKILSATIGLEETEKETVVAELSKMAVGGVVKDATDVTTVLISWDATDVNERVP